MKLRQSCTGALSELDSSLFYNNIFLFQCQNTSSNGRTVAFITSCPWFESGSHQFRTFFRLVLFEFALK